MAKQRQLLPMMKIGVSASFITLFILLHGVFSVYLSQKKPEFFLHGISRQISVFIFAVLQAGGYCTK